MNFLIMKLAMKYMIVKRTVTHTKLYQRKPALMAIGVRVKNSIRPGGETRKVKTTSAIAKAAP